MVKYCGHTEVKKEFSSRRQKSGMEFKKGERNGVREMLV